MIFLSEGVGFFCGVVLRSESLTCIPSLTVMACFPHSLWCMLLSPLGILMPTYLLSADSGVVGLDAALACFLPLAQLWSAASDFCIILPR